VKKIWTYLRNHLKEDFKLSHYVIIFLFLATCLALNYSFRFYSSVLQPQTGITKFFYYFLFYAFAYSFALATFIITRKRQHILTRQDFWFKSFLIVTIISFDHSLPFLRPLIYNFFIEDIQLWSLKVVNNVSSLLTVVVPILLYYFYFEKQESHIYGFQLKQFDFKPYVVLLLLMAPLIIAASFTEGFQQQYPMYKTSQAHVYFGVPEWVTTAGYELAYGFDFVSVEFLFRGFMVIGMAGILGRGAVLSMVVAYCFLHFGKPAGEAISSIFGGYIIGVIAYETKSIWGGILIHLGIAWGMECAAYLSKSMNLG
jgi:hypothetical protein